MFRRNRCEILVKERKAMSETHRTYLPAAGKDWALPFYDPMVKLLGGDAARRKLLDQAALAPRHRVLDIGCGTGTLVTLMKRLYPGLEVVGLDPDPKALARAKMKACALERRSALTAGSRTNCLIPMRHSTASFPRSCFIISRRNLAERPCGRCGAF
jgi:SAM-dependent methyltransferase